MEVLALSFMGIICCFFELLLGRKLNTHLWLILVPSSFKVLVGIKREIVAE